MDAQKMWTITEDDNSMVSSTHQSPSSRQAPSFHTNSEGDSSHSQNNSEPQQNNFIDGNRMLSPVSDRNFAEEDFGPSTEYSQNSFNFFAESPAPSPINDCEARDVFRSERNLHFDGRKRPQSANPNHRPHHLDVHNSNKNPSNSTRPSSAENNIPSFISPPSLKSKGKSSSFGEAEFETVMMPLNDFQEQRKDLDKLPRSKRLVRRMESPVGITLLQLDERDMLVGKDENWQLSKNGRVRNLKDMEAVRHSRKRDSDSRREHPPRRMQETSPPQRRPLTGHRRSHAPQSNQRPLSASPRVQRSEGWQDGGIQRRVEWSESEVSGIVEDDGEDDIDTGWLFENGFDDNRITYAHEKSDRGTRRQGARQSGLASRVEQLGAALRSELRQWSLAEVWDRVLDPARKGYFGLPELVQVLSDSGLSCTLVEAEELLGVIGQHRGQKQQSRVSFAQFQRFYRGEQEPETRGWVKDEAVAKPSVVSSTDLHSLLENLEIRASKLKFPVDPEPAKKKSQEQTTQRRKQTSRHATSIVLI